LNEKAENAGALIIPGSLERLVLSGRISKFQFAIGQLLQVVPIFILEDGTLKVLKKERTRKKAIESLIKEFENKNIQEFSILEYNLNELEVVKNRMNVEESIALHTSLLIHFGEGSFGILY
jgi:fatty acid-binding protein DegV